MIPAKTTATQAERDTEAARANRDPLTGKPGAHPVGTGVGAASGGAVGLGIGAAVAGPVGAAVGAAVGAVAGAFGGKAAAEAIDPTVEEAYWRSTYKTRPYVEANAPFDVYAPAYRFGWESRRTRKDLASRTFTEVEKELAADWAKVSKTSSLAWEKAKHAVGDAWDRISLSRAEGEGMVSGGHGSACCGSNTDACDSPAKKN